MARGSCGTSPYNAFGPPPLSQHALVPVGFRQSGKLGDPRTSLRVLPGCARNTTTRLTAHTRRAAFTALRFPVPGIGSMTLLMALEESGSWYPAYRALPTSQVPAALPHVHGSPVRGVPRRLRRPAPCDAAGDPAFPRRCTCRARRRCRVRLLESGHSRPPSTRKVQATPWQSPYHAGPGIRRGRVLGARGRLLTSLGAAVQAIRLSPYRAGLAQHGPTRLPTACACAACYCPLWLSPPGKPLTQRSVLPHPSFL